MKEKNGEQKIGKGAKKRIKSLRKYRIKVERIDDESTWLCLQKKLYEKLYFINSNLHNS